MPLAPDDSRGEKNSKGRVAAFPFDAQQDLISTPGEDLSPARATPLPSGSERPALADRVMGALRAVTRNNEFSG